MVCGPVQLKTGVGVRRKARGVGCTGKIVYIDKQPCVCTCEKEGGGGGGGGEGGWCPRPRAQCQHCMILPTQFGIRGEMRQRTGLLCGKERGGVCIIQWF